MKRISYCVLSLLIFVSCSSCQGLGLNKSYTPFYACKLDSLSQLIRPVKYDMYTVDFGNFDRSRFDSLDEMEIIRMGAPFEKELQQKYLFSEFLNRMRGCLLQDSSLTVQRLEAVLGPPTLHQYKSRGSGDIMYAYVFNSGLECPDCNAGFNRMFDSCNYVTFSFVGGRLREVYHMFY